MSRLPAARWPLGQQESFLAFTNITGMQTERSSTPSSANRGAERRGEMQLSSAPLLNMVLLLRGRGEPHVLLLGGGGKGNISWHLSSVRQSPLPSQPSRSWGWSIPVDEDQLWLTGLRAAKLLGWCWGVSALPGAHGEQRCIQTLQEGNSGTFTGTLKELCPRGASD